MTKYKHFHNRCWKTTIEHCSKETYGLGLHKGLGAAERDTTWWLGEVKTAIRSQEQSEQIEGQTCVHKCGS